MRYPQGQMFSVTLGLGRLANHHRRTICLKMQCAQTAEMKAKNIYRADLEKEIGKDAPIWNKVLTVESVELVPSELAFDLAE